MKRSGPLKRRTRIKAVNAKRKGARFPKRRNWAYCYWIRGEQCVLRSHASHSCNGPIQCCHVVSRGAGGVDKGNTFPACACAHRTQHVMGIKSFQAFYNLDLARVAADLATRYPGPAARPTNEEPHE